MQIKSRFVLSLLASAVITGCADVIPTRLIGDTAGAASGAFLGHALGKDSPLITAAGAGAGVDEKFRIKRSFVVSHGNGIGQPPDHGGVR
jgi:hypothetical protein